MPAATQAPLPPINFSALADALLLRADSLVTDWLPGGTRRGHEYVCGSLSGGAGSSTSVNMTNGRWADFAADEKGNDLISLYAAINDLSMGHAAVAIARLEGLEDVAGVQHAAPGAAPPPAPKPRPPAAPAAVPRPAEGWCTTTPVPAIAPKPSFYHQFRAVQDIAHTATYAIDGELFGYVARFTTSDGGKETLPYTWCTSALDNSSKWHWRAWDDPRPLYFPGHVSPLGATGPDGHMPTVVLVEGEKKADILQALLTAAMPGVYLVASWSGGCKAWRKADWRWLNGCTVLLWPDCDAHRAALTKQERTACANDADLAAAKAAKPLLPAHKQPGMMAMLGIGALLVADHACTVSMLPIPDPGTVPAGWDCADAITTDGWDADRVLSFFGQAGPLPAPDEVAAKPKKIDGPVSTSSPDMADDDGITIVAGRPIPDWLIYYYNETKKSWYTSRKMVILILERDPLLAPVLSYNELSNTVQSRTPWPWPHGPAGDVTDAVDLMLGKYLTDKYGLPSMPRNALMEAIQTVAYTRRYHPIREYLQAQVWDQKPRVDKWLMYAIGETPDTITPAMAEYLQIVGRCWLLGMIKRAMEPGCKFDYCPVLEGVGGLRKSTLVEVLAGATFYSDTPFEVGHGKEAQEQVQGMWLYEIAEMSNFNKAEVGSIKGFISSKVDRYRVAYAATVGSFPRQCVLVGTTNENTYLRDRTGNRRFWPVPVRNVINTEWVQRMRDQLMAEAYHLWAQNPAKLQYTPTPDQERRLFAPMQESRLQETAVVSKLLHLLTRSPTATQIGSIVNDLTQFVTISQLVLALGVEAAKSTQALETQIRGWLDHQGWRREKKQINGARAWGYTRPADWPPKDEAEDMTAAPVPRAVVGPVVEEGDDAPF